MAITDQWDLLNLLNNKNQGYNLPVSSGLQFEPLPLPTINTTPAPAAEANKNKSGWDRFGEFLKSAAPGFLVGLAASNPIAAGSAIDAWNQAKAAKQQADAQQFLRDLQMKNYLLNQEKFEYEKGQNALEQARQDYLDKVAENAAKAKAEEEAAKATESKRRWEEEQRLKWYEATKEKGTSKSGQPTEQQIQLARQISSQAGKYRSKNDYLADLRRYRDEIINQIGIDQYNKLFTEANQLTDNIWPGGKTAGAQFIPGSSSPIRGILGIQQRPKTFVARKSNQQKSNRKSTKTVMIYDPKTGKLVRKNEG